MVYLSNEMKTIVASPVFRKFTQVNWLDLYRETMARKIEGAFVHFSLFRGKHKNVIFGNFQYMWFSSYTNEQDMLENRIQEILQ